MTSEEKPRDFLRGFFGKILAELGVCLIRLDELMENYLVDPNNFPNGKIPLNSKDRMVARGNARKEILSSPTMSFKVFNKGLRFLNVKEFSFRFDLVFANEDKKTYVNKDENLRRLFNDILLDLNLNTEKLNSLLEEYLDDQANFSDEDIPKSLKDRNSKRTYLKKEVMMGSKMTFKVFVRALRIIKVATLTMWVVLKHRNNVTTEHCYQINLRKKCVSSYRAPLPKNADKLLYSIGKPFKPIKIQIG